MIKLLYNKNIFFLFFSFFVFYLATNQLTLNVFFVGDDFTMLDFKDPNYLKSFLFTDSWWRPFKNIFYNFYNLNFYLDSKIIVQSKILIHIFITSIIFLYFVSYSKRLGTSLLLSILFLFHQSGVIAVVGIDTLDQQLCTLFGILSFILIHFFCQNKKKKYLYFSLLFMFLSLLSKENGISFIFTNSLMLIFFNHENEIMNLRKQILKNLIPLSFIVIVLFIFIFLRFYLNATWQPNIGDNRYSIGFAYSLKNFFQYYISILNPIDNTLIYLLIKNLGVFNISIIIIFCLLFLFYFLFFNLFINRNLILYFLIFISSSFPIFLLSHISELYTYHSIFFFCFFILNFFVQNKENNILKKILIISFIFISSVSYVTKLININKNSILSKNLLTFFDEIKDQPKSTSFLYFIENKDIFSKYSAFKVNSIEMLVPRFYVRQDYKFDFIPILENNKRIFSNGKNFKINSGDGKSSTVLILDEILTNPNFTLLYLDSPKKLENFNDVFKYFLNQKQCILVIKPISHIDKKICNNVFNSY